jgi:hypothetical protein
MGAHGSMNSAEISLTNQWLKTATALDERKKRCNVGVGFQDQLESYKHARLFGARAKF